MAMQDLMSYVAERTYPGRGIFIGKTKDKKHAVLAYFIMGRSENSQNRVFEKDGEGIQTKAFDVAKLVDPSLIIYSPVRVSGNYTFVTNGDQTDTVYDFYKDGKTFEQALQTRTFEPDEPNYTPRISSQVVLDDKCFHYDMSILKARDGNPKFAERLFFSFENVPAGTGHIIHTYEQNIEPLPSFAGAPIPLRFGGDLDTFTHELWNVLNDETKVSLFVRYIDIKSKKYDTRIRNKHEE